MKISVDDDACEAHGQCFMVDEELFTLDDAGFCTIGSNKSVPPEKTETAREGVYVCPVKALSIEEG